MSVFAGFNEKQQEAQYNYLLRALVHALNKRVMKFYKNEVCNESSFSKLIIKIEAQLQELENMKEYEP